MSKQGAGDITMCSVAGCDKPSLARGWCNAHWKRWRRHGYPEGGQTDRGEPRRFLDAVALVYDGHDCLIWPFARNGYGYGLIRDGGAMVLVPRLICEAVHGPPPTPKHEAAHSCGKGHEGCVAKRHLRWATRVENFADKIVHGTIVRGEWHTSAKLTEADVRAIRALEGTASQRALAKRFGVSQRTVGQIQRREHWAWLDV